MTQAEEIRVLKREFQRMLNKVNVVTAFHRHGNEIPERALTELSNRQVEVEEALREAGVNLHEGNE